MFVTCFVYLVPSEVVLLPELSNPVVLPPSGFSVLVLVDAVPAQPVPVRVELDVADVVALDTCGHTLYSQALLTLIPNVV